MLFYKVTGVQTDPEWERIYKDREDWHLKKRSIRKKTETFNTGLGGESCVFVCEADEDSVTLGVACAARSDPEKLSEEFLRHTGLMLGTMSMDEVMFADFQSMLNNADCESNISDDKRLLGQIGLLPLKNGHLVYGENISEPGKKKEAYARACRLLCGDALSAELDRIYAGRKGDAISGHPVHYLIRTDDEDTRREAWQTLIGALYDSGRLGSRRYCYLDFGPSHGFSDAAYECLYKSCEGGAIVVRYDPGNEAESDQADGGREVIEVLCRMMSRYRNRVLTILWLPRVCSRTAEIFRENIGDMALVEISEDPVRGERAEEYLRMLAREAHVRTDKKLFAALGEDRDWLAPDLRTVFDRWYDRKLRNSIYPQYRETETVSAVARKETPKGSAYDELMSMVGIEEAKKVINQALDYRKAQKVFAGRGVGRERPSMHMVFTGNPGTAKTTVARLLARIMRENGLLQKGTFVECGRGDLVGKYVGWTAPTIQKKFKEAEGGVLFIDEAYSLVDDRDGSYGDEAINTIVQEMENHREDVVVVFAGYPDKMEGFLGKNPGLRSRIAWHVNFADYGTEDLLAIAELIAERGGMKLTGEAAAKLAEEFGEARKRPDFGNGRYVRTAVEKARMAQLSRLLRADPDSVRDEDLLTITGDDVEITSLPVRSEIRIGFAAS